MKPIRTIIAALATQFVLLVSTLIVGQTAPANPSGNPNAAQVPTVTVNLTVTDDAKNSVDDIAKADVKVFEDNVEQTILSLEKDEQPVDCAILLDTSQSFRNLMVPMAEAVRQIIDNKRPDDEIFVERFISSDKIETLQEFTRDKELLLKSVQSLYIEGGQSAILDAVYLGIQHTVKHNQNNRRQALVLITDGEDRMSFYTLDAVVKMLRKVMLPIFIIGITGMLDKEGSMLRPSPRDKAEKLLATIAEESGGRLFYASKLADMTKAVTEINRDLHRQLVLSYQPTANTNTGFRKVQVKLVETPERKNWKVITWRGYYATDPDAKSKSKDKKP